MRVDVYLLPDRPWPVLLDRARRAEAMGFGCVWVPDHLGNALHPDEDWFEAWTLLGALSTVTERIRLGPLVSSITIRNPVLVAHAAATMDHLSGGRCELGVGAGGSALDHARSGIPKAVGSERSERFEEAVSMVSQLLTEGRVTSPGAHLGSEGAAIAPLPIQRPRPPITIGALGERSMRTAARFADAWNTQPIPAGGGPGTALRGSDELALYRQRTIIVDHACESIGRDPTTLRRSYLMLGTYRKGPGKPSDFVPRAESLRDAGADELIVFWPEAEMDEPDLELLATRHLPNL